MDFNSFKTDSVMENGGVWRPCGKGRILVASSSSDRYRKVLSRLLGPHEASIALGAMDEDEAKEIMLRAVAEGLLLNWEGFTENGQPIEFSVDNAIRVMRETPRFRQFVESEAGRIENFKRKKEDAEIKNSEPVSGSN